MTLYIPTSISGFLLSQNLNKKTQNLNDSSGVHDKIAYKPESHFQGLDVFSAIFKGLSHGKYLRQ
jgi:hypothetical protein